MASGRRSGETRVNLHSITVPWPITGSYGIKFIGTAPVVVAYVAPGSSAEAAGVKVGDLVARVNGRDVTYSSQENVHSILKYSQGSAVSLYLGRPFPIPVTEKERQRAFIALLSKLETVEESTDKEVEAYKATIDSAFQEVQDILGSLGGEDMDQVVPDIPGVQEVTIPCYDSDSLSSPPPSDEEEGGVDPLLDFSLEDELSHTPGKPQIQSQLEVERGLRGMMGIIEGVQERQRGKREEEEQRKKRGLVTSEASIALDRRKKRAERGGSPQMTQQPPGARPTPVQTSQPLREPVKRQMSREKKEPVPTRFKSQSPPTDSRQRSEEKEEEPVRPPIPPYNPPHGGEPFLLSNKPEYKEALRKETHTYEAVDPESMARYRSQSPPQKPEGLARKFGSPPARSEAAIMSGPVHMRRIPSPQGEPPIVQLRVKKSPDRLPEAERGGYIADPGKRQKSFEPQRLQKGAKVTDVQELSMACSGLPSRVKEWRGEEVGVWLRQLSPTLYEFYFPCFSKHDITGRSLMRLNDTSLKSLGIDDPKHRRLLATRIMRLKIRQEARELRDLEGRIERSVI